VAKDAFDVDELRGREKIQSVLLELENRSQMLEIKGELVSEIRSYFDVAKNIPKVISTGDARSVAGAQGGIHLIQARLDRVIEIQMSAGKVVRALGKLEVLARCDLARAGVINHKTSGAAAKQTLSLVLPELTIHQQNWLSFDRQCQQLMQHLGDAKDTIRMQIKLDENTNWSRRYGGS
jgi:hypothetical protein